MLKKLMLAALLFGPAQGMAETLSEASCHLLGQKFTEGGSVKMGGQNLHCVAVDSRVKWVAIPSDTLSFPVVLCLSDGKFFSEGAVVGTRTCGEDGVWEAQ